MAWFLHFIVFESLYMISKEAVTQSCEYLFTYLSTAHFSFHGYSLDSDPCFQKHYIIVPYTISAVFNLLPPWQLNVPVVDSSKIHYYFQQLVTYN